MTPDDYDTEDDQNTRPISVKRITDEVKAFQEEHPFAPPPEPAPEPTAPPEGGEGDDDHSSDGEEPAIDRADHNYTADANAAIAIGA